MCYKKPGPRCSSHAKARLLKALQAKKDFYRTHELGEWESIDHIKREIQDAEIDFEATPAGMKYLELRIDQYDGNRRKEYEEKLSNAKMLRKMQLEAIKETDNGDMADHPHQSVSTGHTAMPTPGEIRQGFGNKENEDYSRASQALADRLTPDQAQTVSWYTSDGFVTINHHLNNPDEDIKSRYADKDRTEAAIKDLDSMFATIQNDQPSVVYRGLNEGSFPKWHVDMEETKRMVEEKYPVGSVLDDNTFKSTSYNPGKAVNFEHYGVMMEIKAKSVLPVGHFSVWDNYESEGLLDRKAKLRVVNISEEEYHFEGRGDKKIEEKFIVVQCEEVDD